MSTRAAPARNVPWAPIADAQLNEHSTATNSRAFLLLIFRVLYSGEPTHPHHKVADLSSQLSTDHPGA